MALITVEELDRRIGDVSSQLDPVTPERVAPDRVRLVDVRFHLADPELGRRRYDEAHLPGAVFVDLHTELAGGSGGGRHPLPDAAAFRALLGRIGISPETFVVAYDDLGGAIAARMWWMLRSIGHERVAVLDGGIQAWVDAGLPTTDVVPAPAPTSYPDTGGWTGTVTADDVADAIGRGAVVVDARAAERYRGDLEPIDARAGHIPGAVNHFHGDLLGADGRHRPTDELRAALSPLGAEPTVYCGSGVTACHLLLGLTEAGVTGGSLYPGSWSEWSSDPTRPVATGP